MTPELHRLLRAAVLCLVWMMLHPMENHAQVYVNRTYEAGLDAMWQGHGVAAADYDGDGDLDVYIASQLKYDRFNPRSWNRLYRNNGDGTFSDVTEESGTRVDFLPDMPVKIFGNKHSVSWADYDRDGDPDLFLTLVGPEVLFRNNGDGTFTDVADAAGLNTGELDEFETSGATWWDYDLDGWLDLYISSWKGPNRFYRNNGDGTFEDIGAATGLDDEAQTWMSIAWDINDDDLPDLYLANDFGANTLYLNQGGGIFIDASAEWGLADEGESMGLALDDASGDGFPDLYVTNNAVREGDALLNTFFLGAAQGPLQDTAGAYGIANTNWAWGTEFFDGDLDGDLDLFVVNGALIERNTPNRYFQNMLREEGTLRWVDISSATRTDGRAESHGLLVFDLEDDGDLDLIVTNWDEPLYLLVHPGSSNNWLKVALEGTSSNKEGFGSVITLISDGRHQYRWHTGVDFLGQSIQPAHFGLGASTSFDAIEVEWPGGMRERWEGGIANRTLTLTQGTGTLVSTSVDMLPDGHAELVVYPHPAVGTVTFELGTASLSDPATAPYGGQPITWTVFDIMGRKVASLSDPAGRSRVRFETGAWAPGVYLLNVSSPSGLPMKTRPFIVASR